LREFPTQTGETYDVGSATVPALLRVRREDP
jgi:hypothetical protein